MGGGGTGEMETLRTLFPLCSEIDMQETDNDDDDGSLGSSELLCCIGVELTEQIDAIGPGSG